MNRLSIALILFFSLIISCSHENAEQELFDIVWQTIYDTYPDRTFGGKDWVAIGNSYRQQYESAIDNSKQIDLLNKMLFELNVSHTIVGRISDIKQKASPYMFMSGSPEIDIRIIDGKVVVTRVAPNSQTEFENLLTGSIITKIDNQEISKIISGAPSYPPYNNRYQQFLQTEEVLRFLYGESNTTVRVDYLDVDGKPNTIEIIRAVRNNLIQLSPDLPEIYLETEWRILDNNIGYIRFNAFQPENPMIILNAIDSLVNTESIIIDLRGNNGGSIEAQRLIAEKFFRKTVIGAFIKSRDHLDTLFFNGNENALTIPIAILVDEVSISGAELFPASFQTIERAVIIGTQTPGAVMGGSLDFLTDSLVIVHPTLTIETNQGKDIEGIGVIPDFVIGLNIKLLVNGRDSQLEAAIKHLTK